MEVGNEMEILITLLYNPQQQHEEVTYCSW